MKKNKVTMDFAFFAIAFNLKKMCAKIAKAGNTDLLYSIIIQLRLLMDKYARNWETFYWTNYKMAV